MQRTPEPELMEQADQVAAYAAADFAASDRALLERLIERFGPDLGARLVDLGCGPGNISFLLAERFPAAEVLGLRKLSFLGLPDQRLDTLPLLEVTQAVEKQIVRFRPEVVYT
ncbi:MAG: PIG-L family deacetylase, partial [Cyanobacteriota bacterium]